LTDNQEKDDVRWMMWQSVTVMWQDLCVTEDTFMCVLVLEKDHFLCERVS